MTVTSNWISATANNWKLAAEAPKVLGFNLGAEYGQTTTNTQGGTDTQTYLTSVISTVTTVASPWVACASPSRWGPAAACRLPPAKAFCHKWQIRCPGSIHCARQFGSMPYRCRYSNCSATGSIATNTVIYTQEFTVTTSMTCGPDVTAVWKLQLTLQGAATATTTVSDIVYNP
jgi:hypothetical protein